MHHCILPTSFLCSLDPIIPTSTLTASPILFLSSFLLSVPLSFALRQNHEKETALHCAAQYGHSEVVSVLLQELTDPTMRNSQQETPLDLAALYGRLQVSERDMHQFTEDNNNQLKAYWLISKAQDAGEGSCLCCCNRHVLGGFGTVFG